MQPAVACRAAPVAPVSIELQLAEWARWSKQGNGYGTGYPAESCIEHLSIPFKHCQTAAEQYEDFMATRAADERVGERVEAWVRSIHEPMRTAIRIHYVEMPDSERWPNLSESDWRERRARLLGRLLSARDEAMVHRYSPDQYDAAMSLGMDLLRDMELRWARGV